MADVKISALPASTTPLAGTEVLPIVQSSTTKQVSVANLTAGRAVSALSLTSTTTLGVTGTSTLSGNAIISVTDNTNAALRITQLGTGNALLVEDSTNPDSTPFVIDSAGRVITGATATYASLGATPNFQLNGIGVGDSIFAINSWRNSSASGGLIALNHSKSGVVGTFAPLVSGDSIGSAIFSGDDGTAFIQAASISAAVDGTPGTNDMPGRLVFSTTADGASSPTERMRIDSSGNVAFGGTNTGGAYGQVSNQRTLTGSATAAGYGAIVSIASDVTTNATVYKSQPATNAAPFVLISLYHFSALQFNIGAGSSITNQYGFYADAVLTGATNNYGFYGNIAAAANRFNFYAAGTADNFFTGKVSTNSFVTAFAATTTPAGGTANTGYNMGSAGVGIIWGSGAPTATMPAGSIYLRTDGGASSRIYSTSGGGTWFAITSL
jgi:hypothetical protein